MSITTTSTNGNNGNGAATQAAAPPEPAARFPLGKIALTIDARDALVEANQEPLTFLRRHQSGDWGTVCDEDRAENELSVKEGFRVLSAYALKTGVTIWVITEADRSITTILLPENY